MESERRLTAERIGPFTGLLLIFACGVTAAQTVNDLTDTGAGVNTFVDPLGRLVSAETGEFGQATSSTNAAGLTTTIDSNANGQPLSTLLPSGARTDRNFNARGNELSRNDQTLGGTHQFTYTTDFSLLTEIVDPLSGRTVVSYDNNGNPLGLETPAGLNVGVTYNAQGLPVSYTDELGTATTVTYNPAGLPATVTIGSGANQRGAVYTYTAAGYTDVETDPEGHTFDWEYDVMGRVTELAGSDGRAVRYAYDAADNLTDVTTPSSQSYTYSYNNVDLLSAESYPAVAGGGSNSTIYSYDVDRQLTSATRADGSTVDFVYDVAGRLQRVALPRGNHEYAFDAATGLVASVASPDGITQTFTYNNEVMTEMQWSGAISGTVSYGYDAKGRVDLLGIGGQDFVYEYSADDGVTRAGAMSLSYATDSGLMTGTTLDAVSENFDYNEFSELTLHQVSVGGSVVYEVAYDRDRLGRIIQLTETLEGVTTTTDLVYDIAGRIERVTENDALIAAYSYDVNDNRTDNGATYDAQDRIQTLGTINYTHNAAGERTQKSNGAAVTRYQYDVLGNLIGVTLPAGTQIDYMLDGQARRVARRVGGAADVSWLYVNALNPVAQLDAANIVSQRYVYASRGHVPDYIQSTGGRFKYVLNHLGSVRLVLDSGDGTIVQRIDYDVWGGVTSDTNPGFQPFGFAGGIYDSDSGLTQFGFRELDPETSRWLSKDPLGFQGSENNLYIYVGADPVNLIDPEGLINLSVDYRALVNANLLGPSGRFAFSPKIVREAREHPLPPLLTKYAKMRKLNKRRVPIKWRLRPLDKFETSLKSFKRIGGKKRIIPDVTGICTIDFFGDSEEKPSLTAEEANEALQIVRGALGR